MLVPLNKLFNTMYRLRLSLKEQDLDLSTILTLRLVLFTSNLKRFPYS